MNQLPRSPVCTMLVAVIGAALGACNTLPTGSTCIIGQPVTIPTTDSSPPSVAVDFFLPDGRTVSFPPGAATQLVSSNSNGLVTVIAKATDPQGSQDIQVWAAERSCTSSGNTTTCAGPGLLGAPSASNPNPGTAGMTACTEILTKHNIRVFKDPTRDISQEVTIVGRNFAGQQTTLGTFTLRAQ